MSDDRLDITDLLVRYATGIDRRDWPLFRTVFTPDCVLDYGEIGQWHGVDEVAGFMERAHAAAGHTLHRLSNIAITLAGDAATARTYVDSLVLAAESTSGVQAIGYYDDELARTEAGWRVHRRRFTAVRMVVV